MSHILDLRDLQGLRAVRTVYCLLMPLMSRRRAQLCLRLVITGLIVVAGLAWFISELTRDQFVRWLTIGDWLLETGLMWLIICLLTYPRWLRRSTLAYLLTLAAVVYLFADHFLAQNMYTGATYRMASAALGVGTAFVVLLNVWLLKRVVPGIRERQFLLGNVLLSSLAALSLAFGERFLPTLDKWHPFSR